MPGWAGQSVELHVLILAQTNFPCLCSLNTGHSACPLSGISRGQCDQRQGLHGETLCPGTKPRGFPFHAQLKLDL